VVSIHPIYQDFIRFIDALAAGRGDPWALYRTHYLEPNRTALSAWWEQCLGLPEETWMDRVRRIRAEEYEFLKAVIAEENLEDIVLDTMKRCRMVAALNPDPDVYLLVGFFSPDGFTFEVEGRWAIGIGLERLTTIRLVPLLLAHEYAHCYRRSLGPPRNLGEHLVNEGFAVEFSARAFPDRSDADHLLMRDSQVALLRQYESKLWRMFVRELDSEDEQHVSQMLYGPAGEDKQASRAGVYLGWRLVSEFMQTGNADFSAPAARVLESIPIA